ncbi:MAG: alanine racemase [Pyrinomonadaceae bacterium]
MPNRFEQRPTVAIIDLDNLAFNYHSVKAFLKPGLRIMAVVKADAYGHGAVECAGRLEAEGVDWFAVALPEEGAELRAAGIRKPILCLGGFWPGQEDLLIENELVPAIFSIDMARSLNEAAKSHESILPIHVKVDTGMGRLGLGLKDVESFVASLLPLKNLRVEGLMTHFAAADDPLENDFTNSQIKKLAATVEVLQRFGIDPEIIDMANSPAAIVHPGSVGNMVRLGGILYGLGEDILPRESRKPDLRPVMSLRSKISHLKHVSAGESLGYGRTFVTARKSLIATVPIGYHDGYPRSLSNSARVIINGVYAPVVGRISMDWTIVDVTDVPQTAMFDDVTILGSAGDLTVTAAELAGTIGTISYEITCGIHSRVARNFVGDNSWTPS